MAVRASLCGLYFRGGRDFLVFWEALTLTNGGDGHATTIANYFLQKASQEGPCSRLCKCSSLFILLMGGALVFTRSR